MSACKGCGTRTPSPTSFATETSEPGTPTPVSWLPGGAKVFAVSRPQQNQTNQVIITVLDTNDAPKAGLKVYAFDGTTYVGLSGTTNDDGQVALTVPDGDYRFRADFGGTQFWSAAENHCSVPNCPTASITVTVPLTLTVQDTDGAASAGLKVYAFNGATYSNFSATTDADGQAVFILPQGDYRFRADFNGTQFWSAEANHCAIPGCTSAAITVSKPVTVTVVGKDGQLYPNLQVYAFTGSTYTGYSGATDANGNITFTLPLGEYRFRADYDGVQFWSSPSTGSGQAPQNHCAIPGCEAASVTLPGGTGEMSVTIDYEYDPLNRLTKASYSDPNNPEAGGRVYEYTYDAVGNRLSQTINIDGLSATTNYLYDDANRLLEAGGLAYTYDNNGNLLSDGVNSYSYDAANRLVSVTSGQDSVTSYRYNGLSDRLTETVNGVTTTFTMDLNTGLTQALSDGTNDYLYGAGRIAQIDTATLDTEYFLGDALGSVRQLTDADGAVTLARAYDPYGTITTTSGAGSSGYGFTGEYQSGDSVYLRSRFYTPSTGRFLTRDTWPGEITRPLSLNRWGYVEGNPVNLADPSGRFPEWCQSMPSKSTYELCTLAHYRLTPISITSLGETVGGHQGCYSGPHEYRAPGYIEGVGMLFTTAWFFAQEMVYDFATMQRTDFDASGYGLHDTSVGLSLSQYAGFVYGLKSTEDVITNYQGVFIIVNAGAGVGTALGGEVGLGISAGKTAFVSATDLMVYGETWYLGGSLGVDLIPVLDAGIGYLDYIPRSRDIEYYSTTKGKVDKKGELYNDILYGNHNLWPVPTGPLEATARVYAALNAVWYVTAYEDLQNEK